MIERTDKPWGGELAFTRNTKVTVKLLRIEQGQETSLQSHRHRDEDWYVMKGKVRIQYGQSRRERLDNIVLNKGGAMMVARGMLHRATAIDDTLILEISHGNYEEDDIVRYEDKYGRVRK